MNFKMLLSKVFMLRLLIFFFSCIILYFINRLEENLWDIWEELAMGELLSKDIMIIMIIIDSSYECEREEF